MGLALADPGGTIASPAGSLTASGRPSTDASRAVEWGRANEAGGFVVGLPINMDGSEGRQAKLSRDFAGELEKQTALPVRLWDERLTSFQADAIMDAAGVKRSRRKGLRDALAAQVILQSFLDALRTSGKDMPGPGSDSQVVEHGQEDRRSKHADRGDAG